MAIRGAGVVVCVVLVACAAAAPHETARSAAHLDVPPDAAAAKESHEHACVAAPLPADAPIDAPDPDEDTISARAESWSDDPKISACEVTIKTVESATAEVLALPAPSGSPRSTAPWDHGQTPVGLDKVKRRFALTDAELAQLRRDGLVVPSRISAGEWAESLHEIWQSELPLWVSADAIMHAVYASNDRLIARIEETRLAPRTAAALATMHCQLLATAAAWPHDVLHDVDLYLTVARSLLASAAVPSMTGVDAEAQSLVALLEKGEGLGRLEIFGRARKIDYSQYLPRGLYASSATLKAYFRSAMFLSRFELNVVSRS